MPPVSVRASTSSRGRHRFLSPTALECRVLSMHCKGQMRQTTGQDKCPQREREVLAPALLVLNLHIRVTRYPRAPNSLAGVEKENSLS